MSKQSSRGPEWEATRLVILERDGWLCTSCGKPLVGDDATVDHLTPKDEGGTDDHWNLASLCRSCNSRKGSRVFIRINWTNPHWLAPEVVATLPFF